MTSRATTSGDPQKVQMMQVNLILLLSGSRIYSSVVRSSQTVYLLAGFTLAQRPLFETAPAAREGRTSPNTPTLAIAKNLRGNRTGSTSFTHAHCTDCNRWTSSISSVQRTCESSVSSRVFRAVSESASPSTPGEGVTSCG